MTRYFFHLRHAGKLTEDEEGLELRDLDAAREEAEGSAREMLVESIKMGHDDAPEAIVVCNDQGHQVHEVVLATFLPKPRD